MHVVPTYELHTYTQRRIYAVLHALPDVPTVRNDVPEPNGVPYVPNAVPGPNDVPYVPNALPDVRPSVLVPCAPCLCRACPTTAKHIPPAVPHAPCCVYVRTATWSAQCPQLCPMHSVVPAVPAECALLCLLCLRAYCCAYVRTAPPTYLSLIHI